MAAVSSKRSYQDISGLSREPYSPRPTASPRVQTPLAFTNPPPGANPVLSSTTSKHTGRKATFEPGVSIVLIGVRGVGKSTLGVLAATAYNRRLIDAEREFLELTGSTANNYRKAKGTKEYQRRHDQFLENTLNTHKIGAVIICSFADLEGKGAALIREYGLSHPVVYITRAAEGIQSYLRVWTKERINELLLASDPLLRSCSNYEFFNLSEDICESAKSWPEDGCTSESRLNQAGGSSLTLKRVERDFLRLLRNVIGDHDRGVAHHSSYPLSQIEVERRTYTFVVTVRVSEVIANNIDLDQMQIGADCLELVLENNITGDGKALENAARAFAVLRRATILPILLSAGESDSCDDASQAQSLEMTEFCFRLGPEFCTFDLSLDEPCLRQLFRGKGSSKTIGNLELHERPPAGWNDRVCIDTYVRAAKIGCDVVRITMPADSIDDAFDIHIFERAVSTLAMPCGLIAYGTGANGRLSKCFNKILTPVEPTNLSLPNEHGNEDSGIQMTAKAITQARFSTFINDRLQFFIYGADVSYSLSPAMHHAAYEACGMQYTYGKYSSENLEAFTKLVRTPHFGGAAITQPFKTISVSIMDGLSPHAKTIGAVNTIIPVRELCSDGSVPDEMALLTRRIQAGPVKALYGFNTGREP